MLAGLFAFDAVSAIEQAIGLARLATYNGDEPVRVTRCEERRLPVARNLNRRLSTCGMGAEFG